MYKFVAFMAVVAMASAKPSIAPAALVAPAPLVAAPAPFVTASSSQYIARTHNSLVAAPLVAPAPVLPAPYVAPAARIIAPAPIVAPAPVFARYASPYFGSAPLSAYSPYYF